MSPASTSHAIIVADGDVELGWLGSLVADQGPAGSVLLIAADGGAAKARAAGIELDLVVGDFDSLAASDRAELSRAGVRMRASAAEKDESDMELCLREAVAAGAGRITLAGALGGDRPEHTIANLLLLGDPRLDGLDVVIADGTSLIRRVGSAAGPGELSIDGDPGDYVSLFPIGGTVEGVTTDGLRYPLRDEALQVGPSRGLSNELIDDHGRVTSRRGCLLVVHTVRTQHP